MNRLSAENAISSQFDYSIKPEKRYLLDREAVHKAMISFNPPFVFVHVPKAAGSSITYALREYSDTNIIFENNGDALLLDKHTSAAELRSRMGAQWNNSLTFAVSRNPWDRVISNYFYLKSINHPKVSRSLTPRDWITGDDFWCNPATDYFVEEDRIIVDRVLHYETLDNDFEELCMALAIPKRDLPRLNQSPRLHYSVYYDAVSREHVAKRFSLDVDLLGYTFDGTR